MEILAPAAFVSTKQSLENIAHFARRNSCELNGFDHALPGCIHPANNIAQAWHIRRIINNNNRIGLGIGHNLALRINQRLDHLGRLDGIEIVELEDFCHKAVRLVAGGRRFANG